MLLAIDVGNTNSVIALYDGDKSVAQWRSSTSTVRTADEYAVWLSQLMSFAGFKLADVSECIISTVVPQSLFHLRNLSRRYFNCEPFVIGHDNIPGVAVRITKPSEAGADRLVNAVGAFTKHGGPLVVVDSGTATNFDIVGADGGHVCAVQKLKGRYASHRAIEQGNSDRPVMVQSSFRPLPLRLHQFADGRLCGDAGGKGETGFLRRGISCLGSPRGSVGGNAELLFRCRATR